MTDSTELSQLKRALVALKEMRTRLDAVERSRTEPIAIIGMGCRFPGGANSPDAFWQMLLAGTDAVSEIPADRWPVNELYDTDFMAPGKTNTRWGGFLDEIGQFDPSFFSISPREAARMDPQQRLLLQVTIEALENGGQQLEKLRGGQIGVFVGVHSYSNDYALMQVQDMTGIDTHTGTGTAHSIIANRLSYLFDWQGPSLAVDTACSSSLVSTHLAVNSLRSGECDMALTAGVNLLLAPESTVTFTKLQMMSPDGRCKTFDAGADGFVRGEGVGVVILKRLSDALAAGDPIVAVVAGTAVNQDGNSNGLTAPNGLSQQTVVRQALANAKIKPEQVSYVETHGTGTKLGDPIEVEALAEVIGSAAANGMPCVLGSVKTNIGHLEGAAGIAGLIKAALVLNRERIPPHLHFRELNPLIPMAGTRFAIPVTERPYPRTEQPRYAGVSSFGFGGTNAHLILSEAPLPDVLPAAELTAPFLLPLSARSKDALRELAGKYGAFLADHDLPLADIIYTAARRRSHHEFRLAQVAADKAELIARLNAFAAGDDKSEAVVGQVVPSGERGLTFVFSGQGPQWQGMGRELLETVPVFHDKVVEIDQLLRRHADWSLLDELTRENGRLQDTEIAQPAIFALQVGLAALWHSWGIDPDAVVGHSVGEVAAAYVAGVLSLPDAVSVIFHRGRLMQQATGLGKMAAVGLSRAAAEQHLANYPGLTIGAENSPLSLTLSGDAEALAELVPALQEAGVFARMLTVNYAFHSPVMEPFQRELEKVLHGITVNNAAIPIYSTVRGKRAQSGDYDAAYWGRNIRQPVLFAPAVQAMAADGFTACVEISPHPVLTHSILQCAPEWTVRPSMQRDQAVHPILWQTAGALFTQGFPINWELLAPGGRVVPLPNYPWQNQRYWLETGRRKQREISGQPTGHPLLGQRLRSPLPTFAADLDAENLPDGFTHRLGAVRLLPAAAYLDGLLAAAAADHQDEAVVLEQVALEEPLLLDEPQTVQWLLMGESAQMFSLQADDTWQLHARGQLRQREAVNSKTAVFPLQSRLSEIDMALYEQETADEHLTFDRQRPLLTALWRSEGEALARLQPNLSRQEAMDTAVQLLLMSAGKARKIPLAEYLLAAAEEVVSNGRFAAPIWCHVTITEDTDPAIQGSFQLLQEDGQLLMQGSGLRFEPVGQALLTNSDDWFYEVVWEPLAQPEPVQTTNMTAGEPWLILADQGGVGDELAAALQAGGAAVTVVKTLPEWETLGKANWGGVVYLWGLDETAVSQNGACEPVLALLQQTNAPLWLVTQQAHAVPDGNEVNPFALPLWGLGRTIALEHPERWGGLLDLGQGEPQALARQILQEIQADEDEDEVTYRDGKRFAARLAAADRPAAGEEMTLADTGAYLITGGLGNLGRHVARRLAQQGARHLVLTSRTGLPSRDEWGDLDPESAAGERVTAVLALEQPGVTVTIVKADTTDEAAMRQLFARFGHDLPDLRGVVHTAGVVSTSPLAEMDVAALRFVFGPKVSGAWLLHQLTENLALDFFVLFSSSAAILGSAGMGHYAAANAFLDGLAHFRRGRRLPALSVNWGWWAGDGLASDEQAAYFTEIGQNGMAAEAALNALAGLLAAEQTQGMVAAIDWPRFKPIYEAKRTRPLLKNITLGRETAVSDSHAFIEEVTAAPPERWHELLRRHVQAAVAKILEFAVPETFDPDAGFFKMGMDSIMAVQLRVMLEQNLGQPLPATIAFEYPTVNKLTQFLVSDVLGWETAVSPTQDTLDTDRDEAAIAQLDNLSGDDLLSFFDDELAAIDDLIE